MSWSSAESIAATESVSIDDVPGRLLAPPSQHSQPKGLCQAFAVCGCRTESNRALGSGIEGNARVVGSPTRRSLWLPGWWLPGPIDKVAPGAFGTSTLGLPAQTLALEAAHIDRRQAAGQARRSGGRTLRPRLE